MKFKKTLLKILGAALLGYIGLFVVFFFDLDGKALYYFVEPMLDKHYSNNVKRRDMLKQPYGINDFPEYTYTEETRDIK